MFCCKPLEPLGLGEPLGGTGGGIVSFTVTLFFFNGGSVIFCESFTSDALNLLPVSKVTHLCCCLDFVPTVINSNVGGSSLSDVLVLLVCETFTATFAGDVFFSENAT